MTDLTPQANIIDESQSLWESDRRPAGCTQCHRVFLVQEAMVNRTCPLCRSGVLDAQPARMRPAAPELMLPFKLGRKSLSRIYEQFVSGVWIKPEDFRPETLLSRTVPVFWPLWLVDSDVGGHWQMEAGFDYQVESYKESYSGGQWQSRKQLEPRVRWETRLGLIDTHVENVSVPALEEHDNRQAMTGRYQRDQAQPFNPDQLGKAVLEVPDLPPEDAWPLATPQIEREAAQICKQAADAQHIRNFHLKADYKNLNWTEFFLPMYTSFYTDDEGQPQIVVINGESGEIRGPRMASRKRGLRIAGIMAVIAAVFLVLALFGALITLVMPPIGLIAMLFGVIGLGLGIAAIIPAVWPGQWNRKQGDGPQILSRR